MNDLRTQAQLVAFDPTRAGAIGTVVTRAEVAETAAQGEFPATLLLDLYRADTAGGDEGNERATIAVDWDKDTLDQLLASTEDKEIALWFDERELAMAFGEGEVEGHGLRERAAVLALGIAAAGVSATPALARMPAVGSDGGPSVVSSVHPPGFAQGAPGAIRAMQQDEKLGGAQTQRPSVEAPAATSTGGSTLSSGEIAAIAGAGTILISAAGFGFARRRMPPVQPA